MTEQTKTGKMETYVSGKRNAFDAIIEKPVRENTKISYRHILTGAAMVGAFYGLGGDAAEANNLLLSGAAALSALGMTKADDHTVVYHMATAGARYVDEKADQLKKADLQNKFKSGCRNLQKKANMIINMARTKAVMVRNAARTSSMEVYRGNENGEKEYVTTIREPMKVTASNIMKSLLSKQATH